MRKNEQKQKTKTPMSVPFSPTAAAVEQTMTQNFGISEQTAKRTLEKLKRLRDSLTTPIRPGGFNSERLFMQEEIKRIEKVLAEMQKKREAQS